MNQRWKSNRPAHAMRCLAPCAAGLLLVCGSSLAVGESRWPSWRGPEGNGTALDGKYPVVWSEKENVRWKLPLDGRGASTPIEVDGRLVVTFGAHDENIVQSIDRDGKIVWQKSVGKERPGKHAKASGANSSAVTDGKQVFVYFKSGDLACLSPTNGDVIWSINIQKEYGEDSLWWDLGTSPIVTQEAVIVTVMQTGPSFLVALDKETGKELWRADRWLDVREEANQSYTTPTITQIDNESAIVTLGADHVTAHRAADGKLIWKLGGFNPENDGYFRSIASPVVIGNLIVCPYSRGSTLTAVHSESSRSDGERVAWRLDFGADVPTPAVYAGRVYLLTDKGAVHCLDPKTGQTVWKESLPKSNKSFSSSPLVAGGKLYCTREDGMTFVLDGIDGEQPKLIGKNALEGFAVASPIAIDNRIYLRTYETLYCIE